MGAWSETYVDPAIAGNSGTGTSGDPYGDLQYALDTMARDSTNGDRINIKAGTDEILTAAIDLSTYGTPAQTAPLVFQGYTASAGDGGTGGISGAGSYAIINAGATDWTAFIDLHLHNCGSADVVTLDDCCAIVNCEIDNTTGRGIDWAISRDGVIVNCHIHNCGGTGAYVSTDCLIYGCYFANGTNDFDYAIRSQGGDNRIERNIISIDGSSGGIYIAAGAGGIISHNSILSNGGTGAGISWDHVNRTADSMVINNLVEGFSGTGGKGIDFLAQTINSPPIYSGNAVYNNATNYNDGDPHLYQTDNETLGASPFDKSGSDTFANRATYFAPVAAIQGAAYPTALRLDKGAVQHQDPAGGSIITSGGRVGVMES